MSVLLVDRCEEKFFLRGQCDMSLTFHEGCVGAAVVVKVSAVGVVQAVVSQALCVAETLQDTVHETLPGQSRENSLIPDAIIKSVYAFT